MPKIKVIAIAGEGRSGSTLLEKILGQIKTITPIGELAMIWGELGHGFICGCGETSSNCKFWNAVFDEAFGGFNNVNYNEVVKLRRSVDRAISIPSMLSSNLRSKEYQNNLNLYLYYLSHIYQAINKVSGNSIILDSSKSPAYFHVLRLLPNIDLSVIHLVRDSRAVAYSWQKKKSMNYLLKERDMIQQTAVKSAIRWNGRNLLAQTLKPFASRYVFIRYEDLAQNPYEITKGILTNLDVEDSSIEYINNHDVTVSESHAILGNPTPRLQKGPIQVKLDNEWEKELSSGKKMIVTALTLPLLMQYRYLP